MSTKEWIDAHIHVSGFDSQGQHRDLRPEDLLAVLDREPGHLRFVISVDVPEIGRMKEDPAWIGRGNRFIHELCQAAPDRLFGSCLVNPLFLKESLACMDQCFGDWGFVQCGEMLQYIFGFDLAGPESVAVTRRAAEFGVPVQCHVSTNTDLCVEHFAGVCALARQVPEAHLILAHALGGNNTRYYLEAFAQSDMNPERTWFEFRDFNVVEYNRLALDAVRPDRLVPGTDWTTRIGPPFQPYGTLFGCSADANPYPPSLPALVEFLAQAEATAEQIRAIGSANPRALYGWRLAATLGD